ncbi:MAG TPA: hypothetical protein VME68_19880 [Acidobacteriaceae bacterium]|nr:hypothetical protein [Acidobacteriaceae bacterium]
MFRLRQVDLLSLLVLAFASLLAGCGSSLAPVSKPSFTISASVSAVALTAGGNTQMVMLTATAVNGFSGVIQVTATGLPTGVTASPATLKLVPGTPQQVTFAAAGTAAAATAQAQFNAVSGALSQITPITITVTVSTAQLRDVVTYHYDIQRDGLNYSESVLTQANVNSKQFGLIRMLNLDGVVDAQPLLLSNLMIGNVSHNVVFAVTEHDSVYAFDADSGIQLWTKSVVGANETTSDDHGCGQITPEIGITSTPVIDRNAGPHGTIFVVGMTLDNSGNYHQRLHALDVTTGAELSGSPTEIQASYRGTGANSSNGIVLFDPGQYAERAGLLLLNGAIYLGWTSHCDDDPYTGWLMGYDEKTLKQTSVLNLTPNGSEGSIWMAGSGLAADTDGNIYFLDANGTFDTTLDANGFPAQHDYGNGFIKVATTNGQLLVADYFEMSNTVAESNADEDLGSGGALVLPDIQDSSGGVHHLAVGAGKDEELYVVNRDSMGKFNPNNDNAIYQEFSLGYGIWSMPAFFNNTLYYCGVGGNVMAFPILNAKFATSSTVQSATSFEYPGATPSISALGTANGIVWAVENSNPAILHAFNAKTLKEIYNSSQAANGRDQFGNGNKFITPMIANGKVFVGTPSGVAELGLLK